MIEIEKNYYEEAYSKINADMKTIQKELPYAFIKFMDNEYIPFIFKIFIKNYKRTFMNMNNIIDFLLNKYNK